MYPRRNHDTENNDSLNQNLLNAPVAEENQDYAGNQAALYNSLFAGISNEADNKSMNDSFGDADRDDDNVSVSEDENEEMNKSHSSDNEEEDISNDGDDRESVLSSLGNNNGRETEKQEPGGGIPGSDLLTDNNFDVSGNGTNHFLTQKQQSRSRKTKKTPEKPKASKKGKKKKGDKDLAGIEEFIDVIKDEDIAHASEDMHSSRTGTGQSSYLPAHLRSLCYSFCCCTGPKLRGFCRMFPERC